MNVARATRPGALATAVLAASALAAGCGSSSGGSVSIPRVAPARVFTLAGFQPAASVTPGHPTTVSFTVQLPSGQPLTRYKTGSGPHTGVHLIIVRDDLKYIIHEHPPVGANGLIRQSVRFPAPGPYRVLVDVYPNIPGGQPNFQLFRGVHVTGAYHPASLPPFNPDQVIYGYAGADPEFLINYDRYFPGGTHHALATNYRCPEPVVAATRNLLTYNRRRIDKEPRVDSDAVSANPRTRPQHADTRVVIRQADRFPDVNPNALGD